MLSFIRSTKLNRSVLKRSSKPSKWNKSYILQSRFYSNETASALTRTEISARVVNALKQSPRLGSTEVKPNAHFYKDLGMDSIEKTEAVLLIENEFMIEIPDSDVSGLHSCQDVVQYLSNIPYVK